MNRKEPPSPEDTPRTKTAQPASPAKTTGISVQSVRGRKKLISEKYIAERASPRKKLKKKLSSLTFRKPERETRKPMPLNTKKNSRSVKKRYSIGGL
ncbi:MAG: hypothetical protein IJL80_10380 [Treponema sp.]|nr:hypothetical protein [Treponema sp.]